MPADQHPETQVALAAASALPPGETRDLERHLAGCAACRALLAELRTIADVLGDDTLGEDPPPELEERVVRAVARERRRTRGLATARWSLAAAAAAVALLGAGSLLPRAFDAPREQLDLAATSSAVEVRSAFVAHTWGTELELTVEGLPAERAYDVVLVDRAGVRHSAGTFLGVADRAVVCDMNAAVLRPDVVRVLVQDPDGRVVVSGDV